MLRASFSGNSLAGNTENCFKFCVVRCVSGSKNLRKSGLAGTFAGSLELVREGKLSIMQKKIFDKILIKAK